MRSATCEREEVDADISKAFKEYTKAIDMWSVGCILAEMSAYSAELHIMGELILSRQIVNGRPLFPGRGKSCSRPLLFRLWLTQILRS